MRRVVLILRPAKTTRNRVVKVDVITLDAKKAGEVELDDAIYGLEPRADLLHRTVRWQRAKRQAGTHQTKTRGEIKGTTHKMYRQKGTGGARHGNKKVPQFRGGGKAFGPVQRDHSHSLQKKVRKLALKSALSSKQADGKLVVLDNATVGNSKTKALVGQMAKLGWRTVLVIDGGEVDANFARAAANIPGLDVLPSQGANVYDILRRETLVLTKAAVEKLAERLK